MATVTPGYTFTNDEVVTPAKLNSAATPVVALANNEVTTLTIADGAVTQAKLNSTVTLVPTGAIMPFAMNTAPSGWLAANGSAVSRTAFAALFAAIGTTYGAGDGSTTFTLPDLRGYFVRGSGTNSDGVAAGTFGAKQADGLISHTHSGTTGNDSPDHSHGVANFETNFDQVGGSRPISLGGVFNTDFTKGTGTGYYSVNTAGASTRHQHDFTTSSQSPAGTTETRPRNIAMLYCIKA
jgi:microcystin-dependent protein